ncbi:MAG: S-layer homology domain-containing protein [Bacteroidales bacterium]|nr:S-layer homology domain-containing protein [Bacteroidales bacterium]
MIIAMLPGAVFASDFIDIPNDWSTTAIENAIENELIKGYNGAIMPKGNLTRAQMATIINRAFGTTEKVSLSAYNDVAVDAWYYDDMAKAVQMKTFIGNDDQLNPDDNITREEAFVVLARAFRLSGASESELDKFSDRKSVSEWAKDGTASLISAGYIDGFNGMLNPKVYITRAEIAQIMDNMLKNYIMVSGIYTTQFNGNVMINVPDVTLENTTITGDLIIGDGVGDGNVTLDGVTVTGRTVIRGGGINSIKIIGNSNLQNIIIARVDGQGRVYAKDGTQIGEVIVDGSDNVTIEGNFGTVTVTAPDITVTATNADIVHATINGDRSIIIVSDKSSIKTVTIEGDNAKVITLTGAKIGDVIANGEGSTISGAGTIGTVKANGNNTAVTTPGTSVTAAPGSTGNTAGDKPVNGGATESVPIIVVGGESDGSGNENSSTAVSAINIIGDAVVGATLTAAPIPDEATGTYQWIISNTVGGTYTNVGTNSNTYVPVTGNAGKFIKVIFTASGSYTGSQTSVATGAVALEITGFTAVTAADDNDNDTNTIVSVTEAKDAANTRLYKNFVAGDVTLPVLDAVLIAGTDGWVAFPANGSITVANGDKIVVVDTLTAENKAKLVGQTVAVVEAEPVSAPALAGGLSFDLIIKDSTNTAIVLGAPSVGGNTFVYLISSDENAVATPNVGDNLSEWTTVEDGGSITAANGKHIGVAEVDGSSLAVQFSDATAVTTPTQ